ncbi:MAG: hypothetical protein WD826_10520 [Actinomycetota bacterium]
MDLTTPLLNGAVLGVFTVILAWLGKARFDSLEKRLDDVRADLAQMRSDLLHVALASRSPHD